MHFSFRLVSLDVAFCRTQAFCLTYVISFAIFEALILDSTWARCALSSPLLLATVLSDPSAGRQPRRLFEQN